MASEEKQNKTEKPTQHKLKEAKKKGQIPRSRELNNAMNLLIIIFFLAMAISSYGETLIRFTRKYFSFGTLEDMNIQAFSNIQADTFNNYIGLMIPFFVILIVSTLISHVAQGGFKITSENLKIQLSKLNPVKGIQKIFGAGEGLIELVKSLIKVVVIGFIAYATVRAHLEEIIGIVKTDLPSILSLMGTVFFKLVLNITIFLLVLSLADYIVQKKQFIKKLKMSKQDIKEEYKQLEGDPKIKGKQRQVMMQRAMARMMQEVPKADVVITNPDHYALAIRYDSGEMNAPKLIAKGKNHVAQRIKEIAREHKVPLVENPKLARAIYKVVNLNDFIPESFFKPVAEILAYIYKLKKKESF